MLKNKFIVFLLSAGLTLAVWQVFFRTKETGLERLFTGVPVLVAAQDIPPHRPISRDLVAVRRIPRRFREPGSLSGSDFEKAFANVRRKVSAVSIPAGTQITGFVLRTPSAFRTGVAPMIPINKRGYVLRLGNLDVAKLIMPEDEINISATVTTPKGPVTFMILQKIMVLAVDQDIAGSKEEGEKKSEGRMLTLALAPEEALRLAHAQIESQGNIVVTVRKPDDLDVTPVKPIDSTNLLTQPSAP